MTYQADKAPRIIAGGAALAVVGLFLLILIQSVGPYFYEKFQRYRLELCEKKHRVRADAWKPIFGFDMGGRYITGDTPESRALIDCIVGSQSVRHLNAPKYGDRASAQPVLSITHSAFENGFDFAYYEGDPG
ncbi:hypothetical protein GRI43_09170 [Altererythrobacter luteolus]|uniref:Uncharacterized protein n=1 Tax=Pontixanthobacter luteolus TaxID=295089 RepID=A0A6I4V129_9SPHN|nr:hypothetical protein [Pontixanthobacter luteolus]MXP47548.1 hypothetical protein [Pontixanthobacter luteolus]